MIKQFFDAKKAVKEASEIATFAYGVAIASQAKLLAPVREGQLRNSISVSSTEKTELLNNMAGETAQKLSTDGLTGDDVYVGSNVAHAVAQEYGIGVPAQPYLRPARNLVGGDTLQEAMRKASEEGFDANRKI